MMRPRSEKISLLLVLGGALLIAAAAIAVSGYWGVPHPGVPQVTAGERVVIDLGTRASGQLLTQRFVLRNPRDLPMKLGGAKPSCGCTMISPLPAVLEAHGRCPVDLRVVTEQRTGRNDFQIAIFGQGSDSPTLVSLRVNLVMRLPEEIDFGHVRRGSCEPKTIHMTPAATGEQVTIEAITCADPQFLVTHGIGAGEDSQPWIRVELLPTIRDGGFVSMVRVQLLVDGRSESIPVRLRGWVDRLVEAENYDVVFGHEEETQRGIRTLKLFSPYGKPFEFLRLDSELVDSLEVASVRPSGDRRSAEVDLKLNASRISATQVWIARAVVRAEETEQVIVFQCFAGAPDG